MTGVKKNAKDIVTVHTILLKYRQERRKKKKRRMFGYISPENADNYNSSTCTCFTFGRCIHSGVLFVCVFYTIKRSAFIPFFFPSLGLPNAI